MPLVVLEYSGGSFMDPLDQTIDDLDMSANTYHRLKNIGVDTLRDLLSKSERELESKNFDRWSLKEIHELLDQYGLHLQSEKVSGDPVV